jgi:hypothetical protein
MATSLQSLGYLPISTATLYVATVLDFDLYVQHDGRGFAELYREREYPDYIHGDALRGDSAGF